MEGIANCARERSREEAIRDCYCLRGYPNYVVDTLYDFHILRWQSIFPPEDFLILEMSQFNNPDKVMKRIEEFLGLPQHGSYVFEKLNRSKSSISKKLRSVLPEHKKAILSKYFESTVFNANAIGDLHLLH